MLRVIAASAFNVNLFPVRIALQTPSGAVVPHFVLFDAHFGLGSQYALRLYAWAKNQLSVGAKRLTLEQLRTVLGLDSVKDAEGNVIREARLTAWANFRQRALNVSVADQIQAIVLLHLL